MHVVLYMKNTNEHTYFASRLKLFDLLFLLLLVVSVVIGIVAEMQDLIYTMPLVVLSIIGKYIYETKRKFKVLFLIALLCILVSDVLVFTSFKDYLLWISLLNTFFLICSALVLKPYVKYGKTRASMTISVFISIAFVVYILYTVFNLIITEVYGIEVYFAVLCELSMLLFLFPIGKIYLSDYYDTGTILLASGIFSLFQVALSIINEFLYFDSTFTVLIIICHSLSLYLLTKFLTNTKALKDEALRENYL